MFKVKVNGQYDFTVSKAGKEILVDNEPVSLDHVQLSDQLSHVIYQHKSYRLEMVSFSKAEKTAVIKVNGTSYHLAVADRFDELLAQLGMDNLAVNKVHQIKAPMPGLVLSVLAAAGEEVKKGDNLLVLEAMKMENMIKSPADGQIKRVAVKQGDKVDKNEILIEFS